MIHNAGFDIAFLNAELKCAAKPVIATERVIDTLGVSSDCEPNQPLARAGEYCGGIACFSGDGRNNPGADRVRVQQQSMVAERLQMWWSATES